MAQSQQAQESETPPPSNADEAASQSPKTAAAAPITLSQRLPSIDILRGVALMGILTMNVLAFAMPGAAYSNPMVYPQYAGTNRVVYWVVHTLFDMKMMALFSMLFGAGVVIWTRKAKTPKDQRQLRWIWLRRMFWLLIIGMIHAWLIWEGDILFAYAACGMLALWWLRRLPPRWMLTVAAMFFSVHLLLMGIFATQTYNLLADSPAAQAYQQTLTPDELALARTDMTESFAATPERVAEDIAWLQGSWIELFKVRAEYAFEMEAYALPLYLFWRVTALMLMGAALMKMGVFTGEKSARFYALLAAGGYGLGLPITIVGILYNEVHSFGSLSFSFPGQWFNLVGSVPMALGHAGLILWVFKRGFFTRLSWALARVGQMALTNYLMQSVLASLIFFGFGLGLAGRVDRLEQQAIVVGIWLVEIFWSIAWLSRFRFGPVEWLWRSLTYWKLQPMQRRSEPIAAAVPAMAHQE